MSEAEPGYPGYTQKETFTNTLVQEEVNKLHWDS